MAADDPRDANQASPAQARGVRLVQLTDTHLFGDPAGDFDGVDTARSLLDVVGLVLAHDWPADAVLVTGDLAHEPTAQAYRRLRDCLAALDAPTHFLPGNHDDPAIMREVLGERAHVAVRGITLGAWRLVFLNTHIPGTHAGRVDSAGLAGLRRELSTHRDRPVLILLHHHPVAIGSPWMDSMGLRNAPDLARIVGDFPNVGALVFGHIHQLFETRLGGARVLGTPSTCVQFTPGSDRYSKDSATAGYRWLYLHPDGSLETGVRRLPQASR